MKQRKIMDLEVGKLFGEDGICFNVPNTYSVKVESPSLNLLSIKQTEFSKKYKRMLIPLQRYFYRRQLLIQEIIDNFQEQLEEIKAQFYSTVEKGTISVYLMRELKMQLDNANTNMKKKLYRHYLKRELDNNGVKRPFTSNEQEDIQDFKDMMRGQQPMTTLNKRERVRQVT